MVFNVETVLLYPENFTRFTKDMTIVCQISSQFKVYNVTWTRNGTVLNLATEDVEVIEYNLLKISNMDVFSHKYKCMVYKNSSDEFPTISSSLIVYKYSKLLHTYIKEKSPGFCCFNKLE